MGNLGGNILGLFLSGFSLLSGLSMLVYEEGGMAFIWGLGLIAMGIGGIALMANANDWGGGAGRLRTLEAMREQGIITEDEYRARCQALIAEA